MKMSILRERRYNMAEKKDCIFSRVNDCRALKMKYCKREDELYTIGCSFVMDGIPCSIEGTGSGWVTAGRYDKSGERYC